MKKLSAPGPIKPGSGSVIALPQRRTGEEAHSTLDTSLARMGLAALASDSIPAAFHGAMRRLPDLWQSALAPGTLRSRQTDLRRFARWCIARCPEPFACDETLARAMEDHLSDAATTLSPGSVRRISSSLGALARGLGSDRAVRGALERRRLAARTARKRTARGAATSKPRLTITQMGALAGAIRDSGHRPIRVARDTALLALMADILARRDEMESLCLVDLDLEAGEVLIVRSKTDQDSKGVRFSLSGKTLDALRTWIELAGLVEMQTHAGRELPLFTGLTTGGSPILAADGLPRGLTGRSVARILGTYGRQIGVPGVAGHTPRRSMARILHAQGIAEEDIMRQGRWSSLEQMRAYIGIAPAIKGAADMVF